MSENTSIEWADHSFNPWVGCQKVSPACDHCYAETWAKRTGSPQLWQGERRRTSRNNWSYPKKWNLDHEAFYAENGRRQRVFCASLADVFDNQVPDKWREDLWQLISETPNLDWLLLTKRPQNIERMLPDAWGNGWPNVWLGTTVENQQEADRRIPTLLTIPAAVRFLSCEPLLGPVDFSEIPSPIDGQPFDIFGHIPGEWSGIDWVIVGGESGPKARSADPDWFRSLRDQCQAAGVAFFFKQWGEWLPVSQGAEPVSIHDCAVGKTETYLDDQFVRVGKKAAGRMLDGRTWDEFPEAACSVHV